MVGIINYFVTGAKRRHLDPTHTQTTPKVEEPMDRPFKNDVNIITRGPVKDLKTSNQGERCFEVITFTLINARETQYPHHDPIIVILNIDNVMSSMYLWIVEAQ